MPSLTIYPSVPNGKTVLAVSLTVVFASWSAGAPINYGDFSDIPPGSVIYLDVTETANSPGDEEPLFGPPNITRNRLDFQLVDGFRATASSGSADLADGSVRFIVDSIDPALSRIDVDLVSSYSVSGQETDATAVDAVVGISGFSVLEIDGNPVASPILLPDLVVADTYNLTAGPATDVSWEMVLRYDIDAALTAAGIPFRFGATEISYGVDVELSATSGANADARIVADRLSINTVPEPGGIALAWLALSAGVLARFRNRTRNWAETDETFLMNA